MSYSFSVKGATKAAALAAAAAYFDANVIPSQPVHKVDREAALENARLHVELVGEPGDGEEITLSMHGSVGGDIDWTAGEAKRLTTAGSGCSASVQQVVQAA